MRLLDQRFIYVGDLRIDHTYLKYPINDVIQAEYISNYYISSIYNNAPRMYIRF